MSTTIVTWSSEELGSTERAQIEQRDDGSVSVHGHVELELDGEPCSVEYGFEHDPARHLDDVDVVVQRASGREELVIEHAAGQWRVNGEARPDLDGCTAPDLGFSPSTNLIPMQTMREGMEREHLVRVAWLRFPEFDVVADEQLYEHTGRDRWRFTSLPHQFDLESAPGTDVIARYGDDLWVADSIMRDDSKDADRHE